jgi:hypothetical protein
MMFTNHCTECDKVQLIFPSMYTAVRDSDHGAIVSYTCWCGAEQEWHAAGAPDRRTPIAA